MSEHTFALTAQDAYAPITLTAEEQFALITDVQNVPTTVETRYDEDGNAYEYVTYGVTAASEAAGARLIEAFMPAIRNAARLAPKKGRAGYTAEDGESVAMEEFVRAVREFDLTADTPFHHTLSTRLRFAVLRSVREEATQVTVPAVVIARYHRAMHANGLDAAATLAAINAHPGKWDLSASAFMAVHRAMTATELEYDYEAAHAGSTEAPSHEDTIVDREYARWLLEQTTERQQAICRLAYGFRDTASDTARLAHGYREGDALEDLQVADCLDMARSTVNRERGKALKTMRAAAEKEIAGE
jgi:DNA-directed RNA polymerase specialized sigma subunit